MREQRAFADEQQSNVQLLLASFKLCHRSREGKCGDFPSLLIAPTGARGAPAAATPMWPARDEMQSIFEDVFIQ